MGIQGPLHSDRWPSINLEHGPTVLLCPSFQFSQIVIQTFHMFFPEKVSSLEIVFFLFSVLPPHFIAAAFSSPYAFPAAKVIDLQFAFIMALWVCVAYGLFVIKSVVDCLIDATKHRFFVLFPFHHSLYADSGPVSTEHLPVFRYQDTFSQYGLEGCNNGLIQ